MLINLARHTNDVSLPNKREEVKAQQSGTFLCKESWWSFKLSEAAPASSGTGLEITKAFLWEKVSRLRLAVQ